MDNIISYLKWRGDITFKASEFNEVDSLILSVIAYIDFSDIVSGKHGILLHDIYDALCKINKEHQNLGLIIPEATNELLQVACRTDRFAKTKVLNHVNYTDDSLKTQFSATSFLLDDKTIFVSFRGTDDTLVGWHENFNMCYAFPVPAQNFAVEYLTEIAHLYRGKIRLGGHSKGGNLAVWASVNADKKLQKRIIGVYNNDGPGFEKRLCKDIDFTSVENKTHTFLPETSIVGLLLEHSKDYTVVKSGGKSVAEHDPFLWEVCGTTFVKAGKLSSFSEKAMPAFDEFLSTIDFEKRGEIIEPFFKILESTNAKTLTDLSEDKFKNAVSIVKSFVSLEKSTRDELSAFFTKFYSIMIGKK